MWYFIGASAAVLTMFGFVPQIIKILKTKSVRDVSIITLAQFTLGIFLWLLYGIHLKNIIIIGANAVTLASLIFGLILYFKYSKKPSQ